MTRMPVSRGSEAGMRGGRFRGEGSRCPGGGGANVVRSRHAAPVRRLIALRIRVAIEFYTLRAKFRRIRGDRVAAGVTEIWQICEAPNAS